MSARQCAMGLVAVMLIALVTVVMVTIQVQQIRAGQKSIEEDLKAIAMAAETVVKPTSVRPEQLDALLKANESLLARLAHIEVNLAERVPDDLSTLIVKLVEDTPEATPVPNVQLRLRGRAYANSEDMETLMRETSEAGEGVWESLMPGKYTLLIHSANGYDTNTIVELIPGKKKQLTFHCPTVEGVVHVNFKTPWPDDLKGKGLVVAYGVSSKVKARIHETDWRGDSMRVCLADDGTVLGTPDRMRSTRDGKGKGEGYPLATNDIYRIEATPNDAYGNQWLPGEYGFWHLLVFVPQDEGKIVEERRYREVWSYWSREPDTRHVAKTGESPTWTVPMPASLIEHVRECLAHPEQPAEAPKPLDSIF